MARARQRAEWQRFGVVVWGIQLAVWCKEKLTPETVIPESYRPPRPAEEPLTPEERAVQSRVGWQVLGDQLAKAAKERQSRNGRTFQ